MREEPYFGNSPKIPPKKKKTRVVFWFFSPIDYCLSRDFFLGTDLWSKSSNKKAHRHIMICVNSAHVQLVSFSLSVIILWLRTKDNVHDE